jgi:hypothetical protein
MDYKAKSKDYQNGSKTDSNASKDEKTGIAEVVSKLDKHLSDLITNLKKEGVLQELFPKHHEKLSDYQGIRPKGEILEKYDNKKFMKGMVDLFKQYKDGLSKELENPDHKYHHVYKAINEAFSHTENFVNKPGNNKKDYQKKYS